ncbi:MAG: hypothetical protein ABI183_23695 [Polyangiaceae bacterium]
MSRARTARIAALASSSGAAFFAVITIAACSSSSSDAPAAPVTQTTPDAGMVPNASDGAINGNPVATPTLPTGRFRIGVWCGLPATQMTAARMAEMASAGFTTTSYGCEGDTSSAAYNAQMLALANAQGMDAIILDPRVPAALAGTDVANNLDGVVKDFGNLPGMAGYFVADEPTAPFDNLASIVTGLQTRDPAHFAYTNLLPVYASTAQLGEPTYDDYVSTYFSAAKPRIISFDDYPFLSNGDDTTFFIDLATMRAHALAAGVPFLQFVQSTDFAGHRASNGPQKLWEGMQTLAYGGAGVSYFLYWAPPADEGFGPSIIDLDGNETSQYADVKANNARLQAFGRYLVAAKSTSVFYNGKLQAGTTTRVPGASVYLPNDTPMTVGTFSVNDGAYAMLANPDYGDTVEVDVYLASKGVPESLDVATGKFVPMTVLAVDAEKGSKVHLSIAPGDGALVHLPGPIPTGAPGAEAFVGTVRANSGMLDVVDSSFGDGAIETASWNTCPDGYDFGGRVFTSNGFWLCVRHDLAAHTFYVGNVVADQAEVYSVNGGTATDVEAASWSTCPKGTLIGRRFESNGYWLCLD